MRYKYLVTYQYLNKDIGAITVVTQTIYTKRKAKYCMLELVEFINEKSGSTPNITLIYPLGVRK